VLDSLLSLSPVVLNSFTEPATRKRSHSSAAVTLTAAAAAAAIVVAVVGQTLLCTGTKSIPHANIETSPVWDISGKIINKVNYLSRKFGRMVERWSNTQV